MNYCASAICKLCFGCQTVNGVNEDKLYASATKYPQCGPNLHSKVMLISVKFLNLCSGHNYHIVTKDSYLFPGHYAHD